MIEYDCPHCGEHLTVAAARAGSSFVCGTCGQAAPVPGEAPPPEELSTARQVALATRRWSGRLVVIFAVAALIGRDLIRDYFNPPPEAPSAVETVSTGSLKAARQRLGEVAARYNATFTWVRASDESYSIQLVVADETTTEVAANLARESLDATTTACPGITFIVEVRTRAGGWLGGSMRRGFGGA